MNLSLKEMSTFAKNMASDITKRYKNPNFIIKSNKRREKTCQKTLKENLQLQRSIFKKMKIRKIST